MKRPQHAPFEDEIERFEDEIRRIATAAARAIFTREFERNLAALRAPKIPGLDGPAIQKPARRRAPRAVERPAKRPAAKRARPPKPPEQQLTLPLAIEPAPAQS